MVYGYFYAANETGEDWKLFLYRKVFDLKDYCFKPFYISVK